MNVDEYPSLDLAYDWAMPSYGWWVERINVNRARVQHIQTFAATLMFAAPVLIQSVSGAGFRPWLFAGAVASFLLTFVAGVRATGAGRIELPDMVQIREQLTHRPTDYFKGSLLRSAADAGELNGQLVLRIAKLADWMTFGVVVEIFYFIAWALS